MNKENFMNNVNWITKKHNGGQSDADVSITHNSNAQKPFTHIIIRANLGDLVAPSGYVKVGFYKNRMILVDANPTEGYKLSKNSKTSKSGDNSYIKLPILQDCPFNGDYSLLYDNFYEYYYVEIN